MQFGNNAESNILLKYKVCNSISNTSVANLQCLILILSSGLFLFNVYS